MHKYENGDASILMHALNEISYHGPVICRWAIAARILLLETRDKSANEYIRLLFEEFDRLTAHMAELRRVHDAAFVQHVSHETNKEAA